MRIAIIAYEIVNILIFYLFTSYASYKILGSLGEFIVIVMNTWSLLGNILLRPVV